MGENYLLPFPENLVKDVFLDSDDIIKELLGNPRIKVNTLRAIHAILPNNQTMHYKCVLAIEDRYFAGATFKEIGEHLGVCRNRSREILARGLRCLRCLRHPAVYYIFKGQFVSIDEYNKFHEEHHERGVTRTEITREVILSMDLFDVLNLPVVKADRQLKRAFTAIRHALDINTKVSDLFEKDPDALMRIHGFGKISLDAIKLFFKTYGIRYDEHHDITKGSGMND